MATDLNAKSLELARHHAERAGVAGDIHFQQRGFEELASSRKYGCVICNPPYGIRVGSESESVALHKKLPIILRQLPTWSHYVLTARGDFEKLIGQTATRRRKLYNGQIECTYYQFLGPKPPRRHDPDRADPLPTTTESSPPPPTEAPPQQASPAEVPRTSQVAPVFGGLREESHRQATDFANRLAKRARHLRRWPTRRGITCYRLYDRDVPDVPLSVDRYEDALVVAEYRRPHERTPAEHADWLDLLCQTAANTLDVDRQRVFLKRRETQSGAAQYGKVSNQSTTLIAHEGGHQFVVNLSDYLDTGLFLDHRQTRAMVEREAEGKRFVNLFAYTGAFTVYAAAGGATSTATVDLSHTYTNWALDNLKQNNLNGPHHQFVTADSRDWVAALPPEPQFDLAVVDPPTFSNTKRTASTRQEIDDWDVQQHYAALLEGLALRMSPGGVVYFSTNFRRFKFDELAIPSYKCREISKKTVPEDFRNERIHRCWRLVRQSNGPAAGQ